jgi:hypothetical protein
MAKRLMLALVGLLIVAWGIREIPPARRELRIWRM